MTMQITRLKGPERTVSRACLGTMTFGGQTNQAAATRMVDLCLDRGVTFFDTANVYNGGESERILGEALGTRRPHVIIGTKVGMRVGDHPAGLSRSLVVKAVDDSLRRLATDYVDICYLHAPDPSTPVGETLEALDCLVREGKVRYPATSNFAAWQICHLLSLAEKRGYQPALAAQPMYNLLARRIEDEFLPFCIEFGLAVIAYNPLAGGLLTGKHQPAAPLPSTRFDGNQAYLDRYWHRANFEAITQLAGIARSAGRSLVSLALNWLLHHTVTDCVILGASRIEQLEENLRALEDGALDEAAVAGCEQVWASLKGPSPKYNR
jgi:aryl-alcohol dehydrogenase-like predicted oxidoreductase